MDSQTGDGTEADGSIEVSVDRSGTHPHVVISDSAGDDAWVSIPQYDCCSLPNWR